MSFSAGTSGVSSHTNMNLNLLDKHLIPSDSDGVTVCIVSITCTTLQLFICKKVQAPASTFSRKLFEINDCKKDVNI